MARMCIVLAIIPVKSIIDMLLHQIYRNFNQLRYSRQTSLGWLRNEVSIYTLFILLEKNEKVIYLRR